MTPTTTIGVLAGLAVGTYALKAAAPLTFGARPLPGWLARLTDLLPAALFAALVDADKVADHVELGHICPLPVALLEVGAPADEFGFGGAPLLGGLKA